MSNQERESLVFRMEQLEQNQRVLALDMAEMKRQLQDALSQLNQQFDERSVPAAPVGVVNVPPESVSYKDEIQPQSPQVQSYEYQLVFDRSGSRAVLIEALLKAQKRLIIVCPWLSRNSIDTDLMQKFRDCLNRNCHIDIGWGYLSGRDKTGKAWGNSAIRDLKQLERDYPKQFKLKLLGTHEKFLVCDDSIAMLGSHNMLSSNTQGITREVGIRTTDHQIIQGLIDRFDGADVQAINESLTAADISFDNTEPNEDEDTDNSPIYSQESPVDAEEFKRRYDKKERDFSGMNLTGIGVKLPVDANLNEFNLSKADLSGIILTRPQLKKADLSEANLSQAYLSGANLTAANLVKARLLQANLNEANLSYASLYGANLTAASLVRANLIQANLKYANLTAVDLSKAQLRDAILHGTNLSGATLTGVNFVGVKLYNVNLSGADLSGTNLCGANLGYRNLSGVNLTKADLRGANLENANLEKANLTGAILDGANLNEAKLSGAIMPDGTVHD